MSGQLVFMMGEFEARFPADRNYANNHMWALEIDQTHRFGFTAYAVRLLQDVYFLDWTVDDGTDLVAQHTIGSIESSKAESELFAPMSGRLTKINELLLSDPALINVDNYGRGWLFEMEGRGDELMNPERYIEHLETAWKVAQRTIKGQLG